VTREELLVVGDDAVVHARHRPVPDGVVVRGDRRVSLRVVADMDEDLPGGGGDQDRVEEGARPGLLLVHLELPDIAVRIPDGVGATLGDAGEKRLRGQRSVHPRSGPEAVASDAAHFYRSPTVDAGRPRPP
jgi:hypothetical protein